MNVKHSKLGIGSNNCIITKSNIKKKISELMINDEIQTLGGFNKITNIYKNNISEICYLNGNVFSKNNPVKYRDKWCLPKKLTAPLPNSNELYIIELSNTNINEDNNSIIVDGIICSTLGFNPKITIPEKQPFEMIYREYS